MSLLNMRCSPVTVQKPGCQSPHPVWKTDILKSLLCFIEMVLKASWKQQLGGQQRPQCVQ